MTTYPWSKVAGFSNGAGMMREQMVGRWKELTERVLPERAQEERWPLRMDHCFKRVCLDWAYEGIWYDFCAKPAERHMSDEALGRAVGCAEEIVLGGVEVLRERNAASLHWRGKSGLDP